MNPFRLGVIGLGRMGRLHLKKIQELKSESVECVGYFDPQVKEENIKKFDSIESLLFEVDGVVIASSTPTHYPIAKKALESGTHVLIEKPMCETIEECQDLYHLSNYLNLILQVGFLERFRLLACLSHSKLFPELTISERLSDKIGREPNVDVVSDLMIHDIDLVLSIFKEFPTTIEADGFSVVTSSIDVAQAMLKFSGNKKAILIASRVSDKNRREMTLIKQKEVHTFNFIHTEQDPLKDSLLAFIKAVTTKSQPLVNGQDAINSLKVRDLILKEIKAPLKNSSSQLERQFN